jgi:mannose-6-phosphate isomerase-like protein (cupin superfamily)
MVEMKSLSGILSTVKYLPNRTPQSGFTGEASAAFAVVSPYRDGAIYAGHYSGSSEWERHEAGDEIVLVLEGTTTVVLLDAEADKHIPLAAGELVVVPKGMWHRFESSKSLKVVSVTPAPTDHALERPGPQSPAPQGIR